MSVCNEAEQGLQLPFPPTAFSREKSDVCCQLPRLNVLLQLQLQSGQAAVCQSSGQGPAPHPVSGGNPLRVMANPRGSPSTAAKRPAVDSEGFGARGAAIWRCAFITCQNPKPRTLPGTAEGGRERRLDKVIREPRLKQSRFAPPQHPGSRFRAAVSLGNSGARQGPPDKGGGAGDSQLLGHGAAWRGRVHSAGEFTSPSLPGHSVISHTSPRHEAVKHTPSA